jgi:hypothetical protein
MSEKKNDKKMYFNINNYFPCGHTRLLRSDVFSWSTFSAIDFEIKEFRVNDGLQFQLPGFIHIFSQRRCEDVKYIVVVAGADYNFNVCKKKIYINLKYNHNFGYLPIFELNYQKKKPI